jgi:hypothetical protein
MSQSPRDPAIGHLPRRALLRLAGGGALALPLLSARRARGAEVYPRRLVVYHVPEGIPCKDGSIFANTPDYWWPNADLSTFPKATAPLAPWKQKLLFCKGFHYAQENDGHVVTMQDLLTGNLKGAPTRTAGGITIPGGTSMDLFLGQHLGKSTAYKSFGVGILNFREGVKEKRRITYGGPDAGRDPVCDPLKAFDALLANVGPATGASGPTPGQRRLQIKKSVLDGVRGELAALRCSIGSDARRKIEAYEQSVRDIETRLRVQMQARAPGKAMPLTRPEKEGAQDFWSGSDQNAPAIGDLLMRISAAALAADVTRVMTFQWNQTVSRQTFGFLPVTETTRNGHDYAHASALNPKDAPRFAADRATIYEWYSKQFARFLELLDAVPEGDGTLLDHTMVLYTSEMANGHHGTKDLPFILAGSAGGVFRTGKLLDATEGGKPRSRNDLLTAIVRGYGLPLDQIGKPEFNRAPYSDVLL